MSQNNQTKERLLVENGRMNPTLSTLEKISGALGISSSELLK